MASQSPVPSDTVKVEESTEPVENESTPAPTAASATTGTVGKETLELMSGVVKTLTDAKRECVTISTGHKKLC